MLDLALKKEEDEEKENKEKIKSDEKLQRNRVRISIIIQRKTTKNYQESRCNMALTELLHHLQMLSPLEE